LDSSFYSPGGHQPEGVVFEAVRSFEPIVLAMALSSKFSAVVGRQTGWGLRRRGLETFAAVTSAPPAFVAFTPSAPSAPRYEEPKPRSWTDKFKDVWQVPPTPMRMLNKSMYAKLEGHSPGGSIKDRTISAMLLNMLDQGSLDPRDDTAILVTSGSAGVSLLKLHEVFSLMGVNLNIVIAMPKAYVHKEIPNEIFETPHVRVFEDVASMKADMQKFAVAGQARMLLLPGAFIDAQREMATLSTQEGWSLLDQHFDDTCRQAHRETADQIMAQCPDVTDVVVGTGTGATAAGLVDFLPPYVKVHARPAPIGVVDGLTDVRRYNNFCQANTLSGYASGEFPAEMIADETDKLTEEGVFAGPSSACTYWLAKEVAKKNPGGKIVFMCADGVQK